MTIDEAVRTYLQTVTTLTAKVSTRMYALPAPDSPTLPYITYHGIARPYGDIQEVPNYVKYYQFTLYAGTYSDLTTLKDGIAAAFYFKPSYAQTGVHIISGKLVGERDLTHDEKGAILSAAVDIAVNYILK